MPVARDIAQRVVTVGVGGVGAATVPLALDRLEPSRHVVVVAAMGAIREVVSLPDVDGASITLAVVAVIAHRLPSAAKLRTSSDGDSGVVTAVATIVPHLLEVVRTARHAVLALKPHIVPCAANRRLLPPWRM